MTWEYALAGMVIGIVIGVTTMHFCNRNTRQQQILQDELEKNKSALEEYHQELISHCARSAELFDTMAQDYRQLYQHMIKDSNNRLPDLPLPNNLFRYHLTESDADKDQVAMKAPPKDYPGTASSLLHVKHHTHN